MPKYMMTKDGKEIVKEKNIGIEDAATFIVENNEVLMKSLDKAKEKAKTQSFPYAKPPY